LSVSYPGIFLIGLYNFKERGKYSRDPVKPLNQPFQGDKLINLIKI